MAQKSKDWHSADIVAALHKRHLTLREIALRNHYSDSAARQALQKPWPAMERLIAAAIGVSPQTIWPSRYRENGAPKRERISQKSITAGCARNVHRTVAA